METEQIVSIIGCIWLIISFIIGFKPKQKDLVEKLVKTIFVFLVGVFFASGVYAITYMIFVMIKTALGL